MYIKGCRPIHIKFLWRKFGSLKLFCQKGTFFLLVMPAESITDQTSLCMPASRATPTLVMNSLFLYNGACLICSTKTILLP